MPRPLAIFLLAIVLPVWPGRAADSVFHVSPLGNDAGDGSATRPFKSLEAALEAAASRPAGPCVIQLAAGLHRRQDSARIEARHSGPAIGPLTIAGDGEVVMSGFLPVPIGAWSRPDAATLARLPEESRDNALSLDLSMAGPPPHGQLSRRGFNAVEREQPAPSLLFLGRNRMELARWPDHGNAKPEAVVEVGPTRDGQGKEEFFDRGGAFRFPHPRLKAWADEKDLWLDGVLSQDWVWSFNRITGVDPESGVLRLGYGEVNGIQFAEWMHPWFHVVNALSEITRAGEYHYDQTNQRIVFLPPAQPAQPADWKESARLLRANAPLLAIGDASGLTLRGVIFEGARGHLIGAMGARDLRIEDCVLRDASGYGAVLDGQAIVVRNCLLEELGAGGIVLQGGKEETLEPSGHRVEHVTFRRLGWWNKIFRPAVMLEGVGHEVRNCLFEDLPHVGIEVKGNNFLITENHFRRISTDFRDMGAVYFNLGENPLRRGTVVSRNVFRDIGRHGGRRSAVYIDNATHGVVVRENLFDRIGGESGDWTVMIHGGDDNLIEGNQFIDCPLPCETTFFFATWGKDMFPGIREGWKKILSAPEAAPRLAAYPELAGFLDRDRVTPGNNVFRDNTIVSQAANPVISVVNAGPPERLRTGGNVTATSQPDSPLLEIWTKVGATAGHKEPVRK